MISVAIVLRVLSWVPLTRSTISTVFNSTEELSVTTTGWSGTLSSNNVSLRKPT